MVNGMGKGHIPIPDQGNSSCICQGEAIIDLPIGILRSWHWEGGRIEHSDHYFLEDERTKITKPYDGKPLDNVSFAVDISALHPAHPVRV